MIKSAITNNDKWSVCRGKELENSECTQRAKGSGTQWKWCIHITHRLELVLMHVENHTCDKLRSKALFCLSVNWSLQGPLAGPAIDHIRQEGMADGSD